MRFPPLSVCIADIAQRKALEALHDMFHRFSLLLPAADQLFQIYVLCTRDLHRLREAFQGQAYIFGSNGIFLSAYCIVIHLSSV